MPQDERSSTEKEGAAGEGKKAFLLRLPPRLFDEIRAWADAELRSVNGHIEFLLREAAKRRSGSGGTEEGRDDDGG